VAVTVELWAPANRDAVAEQAERLAAFRQPASRSLEISD
jgi:hypothetical protein